MMSCMKNMHIQLTARFHKQQSTFNILDQILYAYGQNGEELHNDVEDESFRNIVASILSAVYLIPSRSTPEG